MRFVEKSARDVERKLRRLASHGRAKAYARFFKLGPGEYGEGDKFLGVSVPEQRRLARQFVDLPLSDIQRLLRNPYHECRLTALFILVQKYENADEKEQERIAALYLKNTKRVNNWDLVDASASRILGAHLFPKRDRRVLDRLSRSTNLWERRIAIVATHAYISRGDFSHTFSIARRYCVDRHDLIHKATGWMLREVGKRSRSSLSAFLDHEAPRMPRTMLRYAIEQYPKTKRVIYLRAKSRIR